MLREGIPQSRIFQQMSRKTISSCCTWTLSGDCIECMHAKKNIDSDIMQPNLYPVWKRKLCNRLIINEFYTALHFTAIMLRGITSFLFIIDRACLWFRVHNQYCLRLFINSLVFCYNGAARNFYPVNLLYKKKRLLLIADHQLRNIRVAFSLHDASMWKNRHSK